MLEYIWREEKEGEKEIEIEIERDKEERKKFKFVFVWGEESGLEKERRGKGGFDNWISD